MNKEYEFKARSSDVLKLSKTSFTVKYADGETKDIEEGILFEVDSGDGHIIFHNGTDRAEVLFTAVVALYEALTRFGLGDAFDRWFKKNFEEDTNERMEH